MCRFQVDLLSMAANMQPIEGITHMKQTTRNRKLILCLALVLLAVCGVSTLQAEVWTLPPPIIPGPAGGTGSTVGPETNVVVTPSGSILVVTEGMKPPAGSTEGWPPVMCPMQVTDAQGRVTLIAVPIGDVERQLARGATVPANYNDIVMLKKTDETGKTVFQAVTLDKVKDALKSGWNFIDKGKNKLKEGIVMKDKDGKIIVVTPNEVKKKLKEGAVLVGGGPKKT